MMLHHATSFETRKQLLDFRSSGQGEFDATALVIDGQQIANAVELFDFSDDRVQLFICEQCGITGCLSGSWASVRKIDEWFALVPAVAAMREGEWELSEYSPPKFMRTSGFPAFSESTYSELCESTGQFPAPGKVKQCSSKDALGLLQFAAPGGVLGPLGTKAVVCSELLIAVTEGELEDEVAALCDLVRLIEEDGGMRHTTQPERVVEFHLDLPSCPTWQPMGYLQGMPVLNLGAIMP